MLSENPIFNKNLKCIGKYNPALKDKLLKMPDLINKFEVVETNQKEPNLIFNGLPLHSAENAEAQAKEIFAKGNNNKLSRHIIFGIGLGYLFKEACEQSKGIVFLYEPDLEILRVTLEIVDFSKELSQKNVVVVNNLATFSVLYNLFYVSDVEVFFLSLPSYQLIYKKMLEGIKSRLFSITNNIQVNLGSYKKTIMKTLRFSINNLPDLLNAIPLGEIKDLYKGKTAIIVSAGPTLDDNIEALKKYQDNAVIICIGQAFKTLASNGIKPDFVNVLETIDCSGHLSGCDLSEVNLITDTFTHPNIYKLKVKKNFLLPSDNEPINPFIKALLGIDNFTYDVHGTVAYAAIESAKIMGCSEIIIVGQDFAYLNNKCYSKGSAYAGVTFEIDSETKLPAIKIKDEESFLESSVFNYSELTNEQKKAIVENKIKILQQRLSYVQGITGEMLLTGADYACYINFFSTFANDNPDLNLINTSLKGAKIQGFKDISLEKAMENSSVLPKIKEFKKYDYKKEIILDKLIYAKTRLLSVKEYFVNVKRSMSKYERELKLRHKTTSTAIKYLKELLGIYKNIVSRTENDKLYNAISYGESMDIDLMLKSKDEFSVEDTETLYKLLKEYFTAVEQRLLTAIDGLEAQAKTLA